MISHVRASLANPNYVTAQNVESHSSKSKGKKSVGGCSSNTSKDRTASVQNALLGLSRPKPAFRTGPMPAHFSGRGHLEGTCMAQEEGLLESKNERKRHKGHEADGSIDSYDKDEEEDAEEEARKVWKPYGSDTQELSSIDNDIKSLGNDEIDWNKKTKYGKKSNANFQKWLDDIAKVMHEKQVKSDDSLFMAF